LPTDDAPFGPMWAWLWQIGWPKRHSDAGRCQPENPTDKSLARSQAVGRSWRSPSVALPALPVDRALRSPWRD